MTDNLLKILESPNAHKFLLYYTEDTKLFRKLVKQHGRRLEQIMLPYSSANHVKFFTDASDAELNMIKKEHNDIGTNGFVAIADVYDDE